VANEPEPDGAFRVLLPVHEKAAAALATAAVRCENGAVAGDADTPARQFAAAWQATAAALDEWRQQVAAATAEARGKIDPAVRAAMEAGRAAFTGEWRACHCTCGTAHPDDRGVCDGSAVMTRRVGETDVRLCAPCAVAQGFAEFSR